MAFEIKNFFASLPPNIDMGEFKALAPAEIWAKDPVKASLLALRRSNLFSAESYLETYSDVKDSGMEALEHFVRHGCLEGRRFAKNIDNVSASLFAMTPESAFEETSTAEKQSSLRVAAIMDAFTARCFNDECDLLQLRPGDWEAQLLRFNPDFLFVESAWYGIDRLWENKITPLHEEVIQIFQWCRDNNIPTVFWNKEDPLHFVEFLPVAKKADYVFTTDQDKIEEYKKILAHDNVYPLLFAAQPRLCNPLQTVPRRNSCCFAGSWRNRYLQRQRDFRELAKVACQCGNLAIYERQISRKQSQFPTEFQKNIAGTLAYDEIATAYKGYKFNLNVNTEKKSTSMFSRRVYELLASNSIVLSNSSRGMQRILGDLVFASDSAEKLLSDLKVIEDECAYRKFRLLGLRKVMSEHTYRHRLTEICSVLGLAGPDLHIPIIMLAQTNNANETQQIVEAFRRQTWPDLSLAILTNQEAPIGPDIHCFNTAASLRRFFKEQKAKTFVAVLSPIDYYGANYIKDLVLARNYSNAEAIGKAAYYETSSNIATLVNDGLQYKDVQSLVACRSLVSNKVIDSDWLNNVLYNPYHRTPQGIKCVSIDEFSYIQGGNNLDTTEKGKVEDLIITDQGISMSKFCDYASNLPSISVIIPTYRVNSYLGHCVNSILKQNYPIEKIEIIIVVNGQDINYYQYLTRHYKDKSNIHVVYTLNKGVGTARNFGLPYAKNEYITFLDDDDYLTEKYFRSLLAHADKNSDIICGKLFDYDPASGGINKNTYINDAIYTNATSGQYGLIENNSLFSTVCAKIYRKNFIASLKPFDTTLHHTEDVAFWVDNCASIKNFSLCDANSKEAYIRRLIDSSTSRPHEEQSFEFFIKDRIKLIERFSEKVFLEKDLAHKHFILKKIDSQTNGMLNYYKMLDNDSKSLALKYITASNAPFLNKSEFGLHQGIAFCHNFSPYADASAYVSAKRLNQLNGIFGHLIAWDVFCAKMQTREVDEEFETFFAKYRYVNKNFIGEQTHFNVEAQHEWGTNAFEAAKNINAQVIYSRSLWAGSHVAAYKYKEKYPTATWIAEFSDPVYMGSNNLPREYDRNYTGNKKFLNTFWRDLEINVFDKADKIIFTNDNQIKYMLAMNPAIHNKEVIESKSIILSHPHIADIYCTLVESDYKLDERKINIGYFGSFYHNRGYDDLLNLLANRQVVLHIFTTVNNISQICNSITETERIKINPTIGYFPFLNTAKKMDYLFLHDAEFVGQLNPYLPSKLADYLSVNTPVIVKVNGNSELSKFSHGNLIKTEKIDSEFAGRLGKKCH